jgi:uncharacterized protein (DUF1800 family)
MLEHVFRRMGFGASAIDVSTFSDMSFGSVITYLLDYERQPDTIDEQIGQPAYLAVTARGGPFSPNTLINDARQRELFRMVHSLRPLQEKMALFWHNHFATAYSKIAGATNAGQATKMMAGKQGEVAGGQRGQYDLFRQYATGNFRDLLIEVAKDPAMLVWLDGRVNTRQRPQENFGRELMELFTMGVGNYTEQDVYAAARVFTGWNLRLVGTAADVANSYYEFVFAQAQHDVAAKEFTFAIYPDGGRTIPARAAADGMQDGLDLINALARHPATARRLAEKLYAYFVSETSEPDGTWIQDLASAYLQSGFSIKTMLRRLFASSYFLSAGSERSRYSWPQEFVARAIKETGWEGLSADAAMTPLLNMGQQLFEPPDVNGWALGPSWFTTSSTLARMNFAATLMANQKFNLGRQVQPYRQTPERVVDYLLNRFTLGPVSANLREDLLTYARAGGAWTGAETQLNTKAAGLGRLIVASAEFQFN